MIPGIPDSWVLDQPWTLLLLPVVLYLGWPARPAQLRWIAGPRTHLLQGLKPTWRTRLGALAPWMYLLGLCLLVVALARPQVREPESRQVEGIDILVALDLSGSMIATDLTYPEVQEWQSQTGTNPPNRLDIALETLIDFIKTREHDRVGLVVFAADAYLHFPLTLDYGTILELVSGIELGMIDPAGTAIGNALGLGLRALTDSEAQSRAILLITDGKQEGGNVSPREIAQLAADEGVGIYSILIGREGPVMRPAQHCQRPPCPLTRYISAEYPVDPQLLADIATLTDGAYFHAIRPEEIEIGLQETLAALEKTRIEDITRASRRDVGWPLLTIALLLIAAFQITETLLVRRFPR